QGVRPQLAEDELVDLLDEAIEARVLEETSAPGADYQFTHALIKETLTDEISITRRARLHARVALMLEELYGEDPGQHAAQLAFHFGEAENVLGSERLIRYSLIAGNHSLAAYAHEEALVHLQRGLSAKEGQQDDLETAELLHGLGRAKVMALLIEQQDDGLRHLLRALNIFVDAGLIDQALAIPEQIEPRRAGANDPERRLYSRALEVSPENSPAAALNLAKYGATLALGTGDFDAGRDAIARAIEIASRRGDARLEAQILLAQAALEAWATNWQKLAEITNRADSLIDAKVDPLISGRIGFLSCGAAFFSGDRALAVRRAQTARASAIAVRDAPTISGCIWIEASALAFSGAWDQARELVDEARQSIGMDSRVLGVAAKIEIEIGEFDTAAVYLQQIDTLSEYYSSEPTFRRYFAVGSYADAAYVTGDTANLIRTKERATATAQDPTRTPLVESSAIYALALVAVMEDDSEAAAELVPAVEQSGTSMTPFGQSNRIAGLAARTAGQFEESVAHFERALAFLEKSGYAAEKAWALHNYAETLLGRNADGDMTRAAEFNAEAATLAEKFGMNPLLARAQALQATIGAAPVASDGHPAGLSAREIEVIQLVAAGKSNREIAEALIISLNTVTHHMTSIFNKTDSANRAEAAAFATRNGIA
ncbi:MAG: hypothetical protein IIC93_06580, partial [Chloroflexi bacterium]|nr:hypothetical protein [Chloroflexota bacterium]